MFLCQTELLYQFDETNCFVTEDAALVKTMKNHASTTRFWSQTSWVRASTRGHKVWSHGSRHLKKRLKIYNQVLIFTRSGDAQRWMNVSRGLWWAKKNWYHCAQDTTREKGVFRRISKHLGWPSEWESVKWRRKIMSCPVVSQRPLEMIVYWKFGNKAHYRRQVAN